MGTAESWVREDASGGDLASASTQAHRQGREDERLPHPATAITPAQAKAIALNRFEPSADGVRFITRRGKLSWRWCFESAGTPAGVLSAVVQGPVKPKMSSPGSTTVRYERGALVEQYVAGVKSIEQQFLIPKPLALQGEDLVINGAVSSPGKFEPVAGSGKETAWQ
jgi:hypothetical protein